MPMDGHDQDFYQGGKTIERTSQVFLCGGGKKGRCDLLL